MDFLNLHNNIEFQIWLKKEGDNFELLGGIHISLNLMEKAISY